MRKRARFITSSALLSFGLLATQLVSSDIRYIAIGLFFIASYAMSSWALSPTINGVEWITIVPFPALYALSVALFYFLLPANLLSRIGIVTLFGVGMYALYLSSNIFAFSKIRTIQLLRAAHAVNSLFLFLMLLFLYNFIYSLHLHPLVNLFLTSLGSFVPILCATWAMKLEQGISKKIIALSLYLSLFLGEVGFALSLLPVGLWSTTLYLTALVYIGFGLIQHLLIDRLFPQMIREYAIVFLLVTSSLFFLIEWK